MSEFTITDSGQRESFSSGMVRDTSEGKVNFLNVRFGPMLRRWAEHLTKGRNKYPDVEPGVPNWTLAEGVEEFLRSKESAERHFDAWIRGERDEDHAAGVYFNINLAEYVLEKDPSIDPGLGATPRPTEDEAPDVHDDPTWSIESFERFGLPVEDVFHDDLAIYPYAHGQWCDSPSLDRVYCERRKGHAGLHAARSRYRAKPWGDDGV